MTFSATPPPPVPDAASSPKAPLLHAPSSTFTTSDHLSHAPSRLFLPTPSSARTPLTHPLSASGSPAAAFSFTRKSVKPLELPQFNTRQIASWSTDAVPVILTLQSDPDVAQLVATIRQKFILLAPTTDLVTAATQQHLASVGAALFSLAATVHLTPAGTLLATKPPGELFARFTPQPRDIDRETAQKAYAIAKALDFQQPFKPPTPFTVFDLYFVQGLTASQIAKRRCSKATVINRLRLICQRTGLDLEQLHRLSSYFANMESTITDPRAKHIHRHRLIDDDYRSTGPDE